VAAAPKLIRRMRNAGKRLTNASTHKFNGTNRSTGPPTAFFFSVSDDPDDPPLKCLLFSGLLYKIMYI